MTLRRREYLVEATYKRDKDTRDRAEHFYDELVKVLEHSKQNLDKGIIRPWKNGFQINAGDFWRDPRAPKLIIALLPKSGGAMKGGLGKSGYFDVMIFPVLLEPGSLKHASTRLVKDYVVHEMIHLMDPGYGKNAGTRRYRVKGGEEGEVEPELYFNDPGEWNAFWQEGARMAESLLKGRMKDHPLFRQRFVGDGSLKEFRKHVSYYWDKEFLKYMDKKTERKFDKRFAEFWKQMKTEGLI